MLNYSLLFSYSHDNHSREEKTPPYPYYDSNPSALLYRHVMSDIQKLWNLGITEKSITRECHDKIQIHGNGNDHNS
jgi:hypothetical protein